MLVILRFRGYVFFFYSAEIDCTYLHAYRLQFDYQGQVFDIQSLPRCGQFFERIPLAELLVASAKE